MGRKKKEDRFGEIYKERPDRALAEEVDTALAEELADDFPVKGGTADRADRPGEEAAVPEEGDYGGVKVDYGLVGELAENLATASEIAALLGVRVGLLRLDPEFNAAYQKGQAAGRLSLRRKQCQLASTNASMAVWLGKQYLGQKEKSPRESKSDQKEGGVIVFKLPPEVEELAE